MNPTNVTLRRPFYGALQPQGMIALHVDPPMTPDENILCAASKPSEVSFTVYSPNTVVVKSTSAVPIAYGMIVVPKTVGPNESMLKTIVEQVKLQIQAWTNRLRGGG